MGGVLDSLAPLATTLHPDAVHYVLSKASSPLTTRNRHRPASRLSSTCNFRANPSLRAIGVLGERRRVANIMKDYSDEGTYTCACKPVDANFWTFQVIASLLNHLPILWINAAKRYWIGDVIFEGVHSVPLTIDHSTLKIQRELPKFLSIAYNGLQIRSVGSSFRSWLGSINSNLRESVSFSISPLKQISLAH